MIVVELIPGVSRRGGEGGEINASVRGLRVCFLYRFVAELIKYFGPNGLGPVLAVVRRFGGGGESGGGGGGGGGDVGSEAEDESIAVVMGEDDQAIPDKWSVAGSDEGRHGGGGGGGRSSGAGVAASPGAQGAGTNRAKAAGLAARGPADESGPGTRVTAALQDLVVVIPRNTHSREAAAATCEELVLEVRACREAPAWSIFVLSCPRPTWLMSRAGEVLSWGRPCPRLTWTVLDRLWMHVLRERLIFFFLDLG